jgi:hypothetical protein
MLAKVQVIFYSMYWHVYQMAEAVAASAREGGGEVSLWQVPELVPDGVMRKATRLLRAPHSPLCRLQTHRNWAKPMRSSLAPNALWQHRRPDAKLPR